MLEISALHFQMRSRRIPMQRFWPSCLAAAFLAAVYASVPLPVAAQVAQPGPMSSASGRSAQLEPVAANRLRIARPGHGFSGQNASADAACEQAEHGSCSADAEAAIFQPVLDGFSARWLHRLGTPVVCAMIFCNGSCGDSDAACEFRGAWRSSLSGGDRGSACENH